MKRQFLTQNMEKYVFGHCGIYPSMTVQCLWQLRTAVVAFVTHKVDARKQHQTNCVAGLSSCFAMWHHCGFSSMFFRGFPIFVRTSYFSVDQRTVECWPLPSLSSWRVYSFHQFSQWPSEPGFSVANNPSNNPICQKIAKNVISEKPNWNVWWRDHLKDHFIGKISFKRSFYRG